MNVRLQTEWLWVVVSGCGFESRTIASVCISHGFSTNTYYFFSTWIKIPQPIDVILQFLYKRYIFRKQCLLELSIHHFLFIAIHNTNGFKNLNLISCRAIPGDIWVGLNATSKYVLELLSLYGKKYSRMDQAKFVEGSL